MVVEIVRVYCMAKMRRENYYFLLETTTPATIAAMMTNKRTKRPKQIHRFLRAAIADLTALSVCSTLGDDVNVGKRDLFLNGVPFAGILLNVVGCVLDVVYRLVLLSDQHAHLLSLVSRGILGSRKGPTSLNN